MKLHIRFLDVIGPLFLVFSLSLFARLFSGCGEKHEVRAEIPRVPCVAYDTDRGRVYKCPMIDGTNQEGYLIATCVYKDQVILLVGANNEPMGVKPTMAYKKLEPGRRVDLRVLRELPRVFDGKSLNYDRALAKKGQPNVEAVI
jgi:hypothetical protein